MSTLTLDDIAYRVAKHGRITRDEPRQEELDAIKAHIAHLTSGEAKEDAKMVPERIMPYSGPEASAMMRVVLDDILEQAKGTNETAYQYVSWHLPRLRSLLTDIDTALSDPATQEVSLQAKGDEPTLDAPAKVGAVVFGAGVQWSSVIGCAQRAYVHKDDPSPTPEQIEEFRKALIHPAAQEAAMPLLAGQFGLQFHPADTKPDASLEDRDFVLYNQCDGYHPAMAVFDDDGQFEAFRAFGGPDYLDGSYQAWALLPDCNDELYPLFARMAEGDAQA